MIGRMMLYALRRERRRLGQHHHTQQEQDNQQPPVAVNLSRHGSAVSPWMRHTYSLIYVSCSVKVTRSTRRAQSLVGQAWWDRRFRLSHRRAA